MGSIISAIYDDIDEYEALCRKYKEPMQYKPIPRYSSSLPDCYGQHAEKLKAKQREEWTQQQLKK